MSSSIQNSIFHTICLPSPSHLRKRSEEGEHVKAKVQAVPRQQTSVSGGQRMLGLASLSQATNSHLLRERRIPRTGAAQTRSYKIVHKEEEDREGLLRVSDILLPLH